MSRYTYTLNPNRIEMEKNTYRQSELEKMTMFHLREICRKEKLVVPTGSISDREKNIAISQLVVRAGWSVWEIICRPMNSSPLQM